MRILAISDSHGNNRPIYKAVDMLRPDAVLFAGDGAAAAEEAAGLLGLPFYIVKGNCDYGAF
ncbi:MAG: metallophosphoesterase family protein, partial [Acutalibacteraceae bacterium]